LARVSSLSLDTGIALRLFAWLAATLARPAISGPAFKLDPRRRPFDFTKTQSFSHPLRSLPSNSERTAKRKIDPSRSQGSDPHRPLRGTRKRSDSCLQIFEVTRRVLFEGKNRGSRDAIPSNLRARHSLIAERHNEIDTVR